MNHKFKFSIFWKSLFLHIDWLADWLPWNRFISQKVTGFQLVKKYPAFYGIRRFITAYRRARHVSVSWARVIQSMSPHPTSWRSVAVLSSCLDLGISSCFLPPVLHIKTLHAVCGGVWQHWARSVSWYTVSATQSARTDLRSKLGGGAVTWRPLFKNYEAVHRVIFQTVPINHPLGPNTFLSTLFWHILNQCYSLMWDHETGVEVRLARVPSFPFLDSGQDTLVFWTAW